MALGWRGESPLPDASQAAGSASGSAAAAAAAEWPGQEDDGTGWDGTRDMGQDVQSAGSARDSAHHTQYQHMQCSVV